MIMMKVLYLTNIPSPYRVKYFDILSKMCFLTVVYEKEYSSEREKEWSIKPKGDYNIIFLNGISTGVDSSFNLKVLKYLRKEFDRIIICGISSPTEMIAIEFCKFFGIPFFLESDGGIAKAGKGIKERIKKVLITGANGYFSTCNRHDEYYLTYGAEKERIFRYPFTSLEEKDFIESPLNLDEKKRLRKKLNMENKNVVLSVGQMIYRKGFDILIRAASKTGGVNYYVIGGRPTNEYKRLIKELDINNIHFIPFKKEDELREYYDSADLFVLPTREDIWGLVINEAMSRALPVITTDNCNSGLEMIKEKINGMIVPTNNVDRLVEAINYFFNSDSSEKKRMCTAALETGKQYTLEKMAIRHMEVLENGG